MTRSEIVESDAAAIRDVIIDALFNMTAVMTLLFSIILTHSGTSYSITRIIVNCVKLCEIV